jgi:epoxide hydrolase-like predicted phosphatase
VIKAIVFDCFGVLATDTWRAFLDALPEDVDIEKARALNHAVDGGVITQEEFLAGVKEITGSEPPDIKQMSSGEIAKNTQLLEYIKQLKEKYSIGLLSNISSNWVRDYFLTPKEQKLFDVMVFSFEVGMTKPDPRIFWLICKRLGVEPHEAVLIDDIDRYCRAAEAEGMQAVVYDNLKQLKAELDVVLSHA